ncbi:sigma 54-interacting transcriptional regulator [Paludisphaera sp.]|uniref:sigma 54-interacting transcriptional regulator n=1 Tax=Paludisphaera sp. TaxID=2017432 RepID=UPI00301C52CC
MPPPRPSAPKPEQLWRSAREPLFWLDADLRVAWVNPAFEAFSAIPADSVVGLTCPAHGPTGQGGPADLAASLAPPPEALAGRVATTAAVFVDPERGPARRGILFQPFRDPAGAPLGMLGRILDPDEPAPPGAIAAEGLGHRARLALMDAQAALRGRFGVDSLIGSGPAHRRLMEQIRVAATVRRPVLLVGEPGSGKRHAARAIHLLQAPDAPLRALDCEALPAAILDRELFLPDDPERPGPARLGGVEGSTVLLGDVASLPRDVQARLVEALEPADDRVRVLAVTASDPEALVRDGTLREDLLLALSVLTIRMAPLHERREEIPLLAQGLLERINRRGGPQRAGFTPAAEEILAAYHWPGNLREMARVVEHAHGRGDAPLIAPDDLPADVRGHLADAYPAPKPAPPRPLDDILVDVERRLIENAMARSRRNKSRAAEILGVSRPRLYRRLKELGFPDVDED